MIQVDLHDGKYAVYGKSSTDTAVKLIEVGIWAYTRKENNNNFLGE